MHGNERKTPGQEVERKIEKYEREIEELKGELKQVRNEQVEYLQNVAHQLVAPLNAIKWHIENLTSGRLSLERGKKVLRSIYSQSTIAVHLAKNFALMSNLEADHSLKSLRERVETVDMKKLLINIADDFQPLGWDRGLNISVDEDSFRNRSDVEVMKPLISQVFSNIIENAIKYAKADTKIRIRRVAHGDSTRLTIQVANKGIPIPSDEIDKIFERGFRSAGAINKHPAGTGFGLYIAERIIAIHKGQIGVFSDEVGETVFDVAIPFMS